MKQYEMCEIAIQGNIPCNAWAEAAPEAVFACGEIVHRVRGFAAGDGIYKVRFLPETAGVWQYTVTGATMASGAVEVEPADKRNHGKVSASDFHFEYQDGTLFYPFGTTVYALIHQTEELLRETMDTLKTAPFNKIRFCVFPKHYDYNHNEPLYYPFERDTEGRWDVHQPCFSYWNLLDDTILQFQRMGMECDLILFHPYDRWGFSGLTERQDMVYLDYLLRRLSAMPNIWWSIANEYDLVQEKTLEHWEHIENYLAANDPYHHLIGNHNCFRFWDHARTNITHASLQSKMLTRISEWRNQYQKPICIDECCYEGNIIHPWGSISGREMTYRFWRVVATGGYCTHGETFYSEDEVLWWAKGGRLKGESPVRIAFLKEIVNELPGPIDPVPDMKETIVKLSPEELERMLSQTPPEFRFILKVMASVPEDEMRMFIASEPTYAGHVGEEAYLTFFDIRTCAKAEIELPTDKKYKLELIDVWNMTRNTIREGASGKTEFELPGKEGFAVLATRIE